MANRYYRASSHLPRLADAFASVSRQLVTDRTRPFDFVFLFHSGHGGEQVEQVTAELEQALRARMIFWTGSSGTFCSPEVDSSLNSNRSLVALAGELTQVQLDAIEFNCIVNADGQVVGLTESSDLWEHEDAQLILLAIDKNFPSESFLRYMNSRFPGLRISGGMLAEGETELASLILNGRKIDSSAMMIAMRGEIECFSVVTQSARPIGEPMVVTRRQGNQILELGGKQATLRLDELYKTLPTRELRILEQNIQIGQVISEYQDRWQFGDFLIRPIQSLDETVGSVAIDGDIRIGQTIQFQLLDPEAAQADLAERLSAAKLRYPHSAALVFANLPSAVDSIATFRRCFFEQPAVGIATSAEFGTAASGENRLHYFSASLLFLS